MGKNSLSIQLLNKPSKNSTNQIKISKEHYTKLAFNIKKCAAAFCIREHNPHISMKKVKEGKEGKE